MAMQLLHVGLIVTGGARSETIFLGV